MFCSLDEFTSALEEWIKLWNEGARPFKWTKTPDQITDRICRYCARISGPGHYVPMADGGFSYTAFVIDAFTRLIPGWKVASHLRTSLALDTLEMARLRAGQEVTGVIHHSDRGRTWPSNTPAGSPRPERSPRLGPRGTVTTTPWRKP